MKHTLASIADVQAGFQFRERLAARPDGRVGVIQVKDIDGRCRLDLRRVDRIEFDRPLGEHRVRCGDVLFLSRGQRLVAVVVDEEPGDVIAAGHFFLVRLTATDVRPGYLAWYLNQGPAQAQIKQMAQGAHVPFVSLGEFRAVEIAVPGLDVQYRIVALAGLAERERELVEQIGAQRACLIERACLAATGWSAPVMAE